MYVVCMCAYMYMCVRVCVHEYTCVEVHMYVDVCVHVRPHIWKPKDSFECLSSDTSHLFFETGPVSGLELTK